MRLFSCNRFRRLLDPKELREERETERDSEERLGERGVNHRLRRFLGSSLSRRVKFFKRSTSQFPGMFPGDRWKGDCAGVERCGRGPSDPPGDYWIIAGEKRAEFSSPFGSLGHFSPG